MAQLIKLQDYISRYETDIYRYPSQFIRFKVENWQRLKQSWMEKNQNSGLSNVVNDMELKKYFLDKLYPSQLKWASRTIKRSSNIDQRYFYDKTLQYLLQRYPDTYLVMHRPIFQLKNALLETDTILITPIEVICLTMIEDVAADYIIAGDDRTWFVESAGIRTKIISPHLASKRTYKVVRSILDAHAVDFPIRRVILSRTNEIIFEQEPYQTSYVGVNQYEQWFIKQRNLRSPLKNSQLTVAGHLLKHCDSIAYKRVEWQDEESESTFIE